jgi:hypothetical protein
VKPHIDGARFDPLESQAENREFSRLFDCQPYPYALALMARVLATWLVRCMIRRHKEHA